MKKRISVFLLFPLIILCVNPVYAETNIDSKWISPYYTAGLPVDDSLEIQPYKINGMDDRYRVKNTRNFPYSCIGSIIAFFPNNRTKYATGFMVGPNRMITAGHALYDSNLGMAESISFSPGRNGNDFPFGVVRANQNNFHVHPKWIHDQNSNFDMASVTFDTEIGYSCGWMGYNGAWGDTSGNTVRISGYPEPNLPLYNFSALRSIGTISMWSAYAMIYDNDTMRGDSGAPIYSLNDPFTVVGIHTNAGPSINALYNIGRPITTTEAINFLIYDELGGFQPEPGGGDGGGFQPEKP